jgi:hypothetical protein
MHDGERKESGYETHRQKTAGKDQLPAENLETGPHR